MKNDEPAFPSNTEYDNFTGMTLRDYFAAKAMQAFISKTDNDYYKDVTNEIRGGKMVSMAAYVIADAMLEEREK